MFMKHYAPNRCEPSIEALNFGGGKIKFGGGGGSGWGGVRVGGFRMDVNEELKFS